MASRVSIPVKEQKLTWGFAAARCSKPECRILCIAKGTNSDPNVTFGEIAHIHAYSDDGPRSDKNLSIEDRNKYENLILLCANHHSEVDGQENKYSSDVLKQWKLQHEKWVEESLLFAIANISFAELEIVTRSIAALPVEPSENFALISPKNKIDKNGLTERIGQRIRFGMVKSREVENFIRDVAKLTADFPERVSQGFITKYNELVAKGFTGDGLFEACTHLRPIILQISISKVLA